MYLVTRLFSVIQSVSVDMIHSIGMYKYAKECLQLHHLTKCPNIDTTHCAQNAVCFIETDDLLINSEYKVIQNKRTFALINIYLWNQISFLSSIPREKKRKLLL